jgi:transcriptional antiterminator RfaH
MKRWYVVQTQPHAEERARGHLERQSYEVWLPLCRKKRRHAGRSEIVIRPFFPRYLFVRVDMAHERWRPILSTFGVSRLVGGPERPEPMPETIVGALKARTEPDGLFSLISPAVSPGDPVRIADGPFADLEGIFQARTDRERVQVLLGLMGREVKVTVRSADIETI